jgi:hypothetical protein
MSRKSGKLRGVHIPQLHCYVRVVPGERGAG